MKQSAGKIQARRAAERAGRWAEQWAALYLRLTGHRIRARRFKTPSGEIDLIATRGRRLIFIEVKQRQSVHRNHQQDPVTARSEERIIRAGEIFLSRNPHFVEAGYALRYDLIQIRGLFRITHRRDVFRGW